MGTLVEKARQTVPVFDRFQKARREFVQTVAEQASRPENILNLMDAGVLGLLRPLLIDDVAAIKQTAALALGRLANYKESIATLIVKAGILPQIVSGLQSGDNYFQRHACSVIRGISKHSPSLADECVRIGSLDPLVSCLSSPDNRVIEASAWALGSIAMHSEVLAQAVVDANAIPYLIKAIGDPELTVRRIAVTTLGDLAKHTPQLAQSVIDAYAINKIAPLLSSSDARLQHQVECTLSQIAKHSIDAAELVVEAAIFPRALVCLVDESQPLVRKWAAALVRETVKHTEELAKLVIDVGGAHALALYLDPSAQNEPVNAVMAAGYIASFSARLASSLIAEGIDSILIRLLTKSKQVAALEAAAWALGQMGKHTPQTASGLIQNSAIDALSDTYTAGVGEDLRDKAKQALKLLIRQSADIPEIRHYLATTQLTVRRYVLQQIARIMAANQEQRNAFLDSGGIGEIVALGPPADMDEKARAAIEQIHQLVAREPEPVPVPAMEPAREEPVE
jgi:HEAT repeat protein